MEGAHGFSRAVDVRRVLGLHVTVLVVYRRFYHTVSYSLQYQHVVCDPAAKHAKRIQSLPTSLEGTRDQR